MAEASKPYVLIVCLPEKEGGSLSKYLSKIPILRGPVKRHHALVEARANPLSAEDSLRNAFECLAEGEMVIAEVVVYGSSSPEDTSRDTFTAQFPDARVHHHSNLKDLRRSLGRGSSALVFYPDPVGLGRSAFELSLSLAGINQKTINSRGRDISKSRLRVMCSRFLANSRVVDALIGSLVVMIAIVLKVRDGIVKA